MFNWHFFHDWIEVGEVTLVLPKRGPFDPRSDEARTAQRYKWVCAECGEVLLRRPYTPSFY